MSRKRGAKTITTQRDIEFLVTGNSLQQGLGDFGSDLGFGLGYITSLAGGTLSGFEFGTGSL